MTIEWAPSPAAFDLGRMRRRPALVLTRNSALAYQSTVTVAPVTSPIRGVRIGSRAERRERHEVSHP